MKIGIDIDGVLNNLDEYYIICGTKFCFEKGIPFCMHIDKYNLTDKFDWNKSTEIQFYQENYLNFLTSSNYLRIGASEVLQELYKDNNIVIITARQQADIPTHYKLTIEQITEQWLKNNLIPYNKLIFTNSNKTDVLLSEKIELMIEDNPEYLNKVAHMPITFLCFDTNYNRIQLPQNVHRIYSWHEILVFIRTKGDY